MPLSFAITGATGFIGAAVTAELLAAGAAVAVLLRPDSNPKRLSALSGYVELTYSSLADEQLKNNLSAFKPDVFVHCAWRGVSGSERNEGYQLTENIPATMESVQLASASGCRHWIGLGSQAEYGNLNRLLNEDASTRPTTLYGKAKLAGGVVALGLCEVYKITGSWLRIFSTYGPGDSPHWFLPYVTQELIAGRAPNLTGCEQIWDYLYVTDFARAVLSVANSNSPGVFNVGSGNARPLKHYVEMVRNELESSLEPKYGVIPYRPDQVMHLEADTSRIRKMTGWSPQIEISDGLRTFVAFEKQRAIAPSDRF